MTIKEILDIQQNGKNTIKEEREMNEIIECVDDLSGMFVGSKRAEKYLNEESGEWVTSMKKAIACIKVYEGKGLNEEDMNSSSARILLYDTQKYLKESYEKLIGEKREYKLRDKDGIAKVFGSVMFEMNDLASQHGIKLDKIVCEEELREKVSDDIANIINEVM